MPDGISFLKSQSTVWCIRSVCCTFSIMDVWTSKIDGVDYVRFQRLENFSKSKTYFCFSYTYVIIVSDPLATITITKRDFMDMLDKLSRTNIFDLYDKPLKINHRGYYTTLRFQYGLFYLQSKKNGLKYGF